MAMYEDVLLFINGTWKQSRSGETISIVNPATGSEIGRVAKAGTADLDEALDAAGKAFPVWRDISAFERGKIMRKAADLLRERAETIAHLMTMEQGKILPEARMETLAAADIIDWFAEEGRRTYGRLVPARRPGVSQMVVQEPVGPVAAFTPWNFPINQVVRKLSAAISAGCSIIIKGPEETPRSPAELIRCFHDAGVPAGVINLVYGVPSEISEYLIPHPTIRKISFTGSVPVGKHLAALAGLHMKRSTMELGGHGPAIVFGDANIDEASKTLVAAKFRNAGQVCVSPTRFLIEEKVFGEFVEKFTAGARQVKVGDGLAADSTMGPLVNERRLNAIEGLVADAVSKGAKLETGGSRIGNQGYFFEPTVLSNLDLSMRVLNEEPFGPLALMMPFRALDEVITEANRLPFGLAAYAWTSSGETANRLGQGIESGMITINHLGLALPEVPFGGIKDSGYGSEGGSEAIGAYLNQKFISRTGA
ncbi:MAG: NAD-dependent succinate-semialdehyde dehydrogenase [Parvibaculaceae bacterium]|nr:NAD-dependent succinate-semialdehyde dehydrogenase [Parvibaculaceae bacterium]